MPTLTAEVSKNKLAPVLPRVKAGEKMSAALTPSAPWWIAKDILDDDGYLRDDYDKKLTADEIWRLVDESYLDDAPNRRRKIGVLDGVGTFSEIGDGKITLDEFLGL
ncbi:MAG: hypothetical protein LBP75_07295 [Planctomycetota bacterium]|jgi:hypothetical protein|nr:hypothetical protein [Planctomycetota bacterium]